MISRIYILFFALGFALAPQVAQAAPVLGGSVIVEADGNVTAKFLSSGGVYSNDLYLDSPANALGILFNNQTSSPGSTRDLGFFTAGTELVFKIHVNNTGYDFFTGPATRNPDLVPHAVVDASLLGGGETYVGFEDLHVSETPDNDYDDLTFSFTNTTIPEPSSIALMAMAGVAGLGVVYRRRRARR